ncbi:hypothetical protein AtNW77_Chr3g0185321 [Arabidopsis thaliana]|uniref:F-box associated beta-propeller type 1 domain-containing protein n=1 Tax=Arabidopsis thaliana TaxID=3702 RepID=A0A654FFZ2_ARATH|nr:unnamed protein product [Arabidopsis thaliana]
MLHQKTKEPKFLCLYEVRRNGSKPSIRYKTMRLEWSLSRLVGEEEYLTSKKHKERRILFSKSVDGLFCLYSGVDMKQPIMVINPDTRWSKKLPLARIQRKNYLDSNKVEFSRLGFGKDSVTGTYKLVWLRTKTKKKIKEETSSTMTCEVFDFVSTKWRR